jgi:transmembrane sensor
MSQSDQGVDLQAAEWALRLHGRTLTPDEQAELDRWLAADPRHRGCLLRSRAAWSDLDRLAALAGHRPPPDVVTADEVNLEHGRTQRSTTRRWFIAASVIALTLAGAGAWWSLRPTNIYVSNVGEIRPVMLADGSSMILNTATQATVHFDETRREIELASGEGLFQVAKDPTRPFIVRAGSVSVRAVGTVFSVRTTNQRVDVTVTEGVVELIEGDGASAGDIRRIAANERAVVTNTRQVEVRSIPHEEAERQLAWRDGMVDFGGEPLAIAVEVINRHNHRHIVVDDAELSARPVVGLFRADDPADFAQTVAAALGAQSVVAEDAIHLRSAPRAMSRLGE